MPRQASPAINILGQPSDATLQFGAARDNRILAAVAQAAALQQQAIEQAGATRRTGMQIQGAAEQAQIGEAGATQRTGMQIKAQSALAGMQEAGATRRTGMELEGSRQNAALAAQVAREGQQGQMQMNQAQIEAGDRQQAAQIRATREENELRQLADSNNQELQLAMQDNWKQADMAFEQEKWDQALEFSFMGREDQQVQSLMTFVDTVTNGRALMGLLQKQMGRETYKETIEDLRDKYVKSNTAKTQTHAAQDNMLSGFILTGPVAGNLDKVFLDMTTQAQMPTDLGLFSAASRPALETVVQDWTPVEFRTAYKSLDLMENRLLAEAKKQPVNGKSVKQVNLDLRRVMEAKRALDTELTNSKTSIPGPAGTVGKHVNTLWQEYQGLTLEAAVARAAELYPDNPNGFAQDALAIIDNSQDSPDALLRLAGPLLSRLSPAGQARVRAAITARYGMLFAPGVPPAVAGASSGAVR